jgi:hypothetical protein
MLALVALDDGDSSGLRNEALLLLLDDGKAIEAGSTLVRLLCSLGGVSIGTVEQNELPSMSREYSELAGRGSGAISLMSVTGGSGVFATSCCLMVLFDGFVEPGRRTRPCSMS